MIPNFNTTPTSGIYLDNAASTRMLPEVLEVMKPYFFDFYGNPSSPHSLGTKSKEAIESARKTIATILGCRSEEFFFTSGGTESNNWAINSRKYDVIISSAVEHPSVTKAILSTKAKYIEVPVNENGIVDLVLLEDALSNNRDKSVLVSVQHANSETGTIQPVSRISDIAHKYGAVFHVDAVQSFCKFDWQIIDVRADLISVSARKIHGPMGIGGMYVSRDVIINPFIYGGGQERGMRSGTPDTAAIVGFAKACELTSDAYRTKGSDLNKYCDELYNLLNDYYENVSRNGDVKSRLPNIVNITIPNIDANLVCAILDSEFNLLCSTGSACSSGSGPSKTLTAMGKNAKSSFRISFCPDNTLDDVLSAHEFIGKAMRIADSKTGV